MSGQGNDLVVHCCVCMLALDPKRARRGAKFCSPLAGRDCAKQYRRWRRSQRAKSYCRLCGRPQRQRKQPEAVLSEHMASREWVER